MWSPVLRRISDVAGIPDGAFTWGFWRTKYGAAERGHSHARPGRNNRKILESVMDIRCDTNTTSDS